jgi:uncharacterized membrane protein YgcG
MRILMKIEGCLAIAMLCLSVNSAFSQTSNLQARIVDRRTRVPLEGVNVRLIFFKDTSQAYVTPTGSDGVVRLPGVVYQKYIFEAKYVGYRTIRDTINVNRPNIDLGDLLMVQTFVPLPEVDINEAAIPAIQRNDTSEFNAHAFKTNPDADAGDLIEKMPGITVQNGSVVAQGEQVQQVLVDGKPYFGNDATLALRNLPADGIDKIQVYDKKSDQAEFTGFDDGQSIKTINIITKPDTRNRDFGKDYAGYGDDGRYSGGVSNSSFRDDRRLTLVGISNNVNSQNFSTQDILGAIGNSTGGSGGGGGGGGGGRGGGGGAFAFGGGGGGGGGGGPAFAQGANLGSFLVGSQSGITNANSIGLNYSDDWGSTLQAHQSYFFNRTLNQNTSTTHSQYVSSVDSGLVYDENANARSDNYNHRYNGRFLFDPDSSNSEIETPSFYFQGNNSSNLRAELDRLPSMDTVGLSNNLSGSGTSGNNFTNDLVLRHKFGEAGRTISVDFRVSSNYKQGLGSVLSETQSYQAGGVTGDTLNQQSVILTKGSTLSARAAYTEPFGSHMQLQLTYNPSFTKNESNNLRYNFDPADQTYDLQDIALSNEYDNTYTTQNAGISYRIGGSRQFNLMAGVSYQIATLDGTQTFPVQSIIDRSYYDVLPNGMFMYSFNPHNNIRIFYNATTKVPSIGSLQSVVNNSNPLLLTTGNPDLKQAYDNSVILRYSITDPGSYKSFFLFASLDQQMDYVGNSTITATHDTTLNGGVLMQRGTQLTLPENLAGYYAFRSNITYSFPVDFIKSNLNLTPGITYTKTPGLIEGALNLSKNTALNGGVTVSSNISEDIDFILAYTENYNIAVNTLEPSLNSNYFNNTTTAKLNLVFLDGFVFRNELYNTTNNGLSGGYNQNYLLWNIALARKFFPKQQGELRFLVTDVLNQDKNVSRTVTETYTQDVQNEVLGRYELLLFTYTFK